MLDPLQDRMCVVLDEAIKDGVVALTCRRVARRLNDQTVFATICRNIVELVFLRTEERTALRADFIGVTGVSIEAIF